MLAYVGRIEGEDWCMPIHGETRGKAKVNFYKHAPIILDRCDFLFIRLTRMPALDDKPFTPETMEEAGFHYTDEDGQQLSNDNFINDCQCRVCVP
jgi:hypothetical protein